MFIASEVLPMLGPRGDDDHFAAVQAAGHLVQIREAGADAGQHALAAGENPRWC